MILIFNNSSYAQTGGYIINATDVFDYEVNDTLWVRNDEVVIQEKPIYSASIIGMLSKSDRVFVKSKESIKGYINIFNESIKDGWVKKEMLRGKVVAIPVTYGKNVAYYDEQIKAAPISHHYALYLLRGLAELEAGDTLGAIKDFSNSIKIQPMFYSHAHRAKVKYLKGNYTEALFDLTEAIDLCPNEYKKYKTTPIDIDKADLYYLKGMCWYRTGEPSKAVSDFNQSLEFYAENKNAYYFRGVCKIKLGKIREGCNDLLKAQDLGSIDATEALEQNCN